jgi:ATP synthase F1 delta subunit
MLHVNVTSAVALSSAQQKSLVNSLESKYKDETLSFDYKIDQSLLAGLRVSIAGKQYDASVRAMLQELAKKI